MQTISGVYKLHVYNYEWFCVVKGFSMQIHVAGQNYSDLTQPH